MHLYRPLQKIPPNTSSPSHYIAGAVTRNSHPHSNYYQWIKKIHKVTVNTVETHVKKKNDSHHMPQNMCLY